MEEVSIGVVEGIKSKLSLAHHYLKGRHNDAARMLIEHVNREAKECELEGILLQTIEGFQAVVKHQGADGHYIRGLNEIKEADFLREKGEMYAGLSRSHGMNEIRIATEMYWEAETHYENAGMLQPSKQVEFLYSPLAGGHFLLAKGYHDRGNESMREADSMQDQDDKQLKIVEGLVAFDNALDNYADAETAIESAARLSTQICPQLYNSSKKSSEGIIESYEKWVKFLPEQLKEACLNA